MRNRFPKVSQSTRDENILAPISVGQEQSFGNDFIYMFDGGKSSEIIQATKSMEKFFKSDFFSPKMIKCRDQVGKEDR